MPKPPTQAEIDEAYEWADRIIAKIHDACQNPECPDAGNCQGQCAEEF